MADLSKAQFICTYIVLHLLCPLKAEQNGFDLPNERYYSGIINRPQSLVSSQWRGFGNLLWLVIWAARDMLDTPGRYSYLGPFPCTHACTHLKIYLQCVAARCRKSTEALNKTPVLFGNKQLNIPLYARVARKEILAPPSIARVRMIFFRLVFYIVSTEMEIIWEHWS